MSDNPVEPISIGDEVEVSIVDLKELTGIIWHDLHEEVDQAKIQQLLDDLLPKYQDAHILTFIPVLLRREAIEILRRRP
jgi:hypothetical protein